MAAQATTRDPWYELTREERTRIVQDMWAAALMADLDMRDDEADDAEASASVVPASKKAIMELYTPTWDEACCSMSKADGHNGFAVCLEALEMGQELRMKPCSHPFHRRCISKWLVVNRLCPICQFALPSSEEEDQDMLQEEEEDYEAACKRYYSPKFINFIMNF